MSEPTPAPEITNHLAAAAATPKVAGILVSLFEHIFLPILPSVLLQLAPKIQTDPTLKEVLGDVRVVIDQIAPAS